MEKSYLLDTCAWLDFQLQPELLSANARRILSNSHPLHLATISIVEVVRKVSIGKLTIAMPIGKWLEQAMPAKFIKKLSISEEIAMDAYALPGSFHNDPANRLIVSTARVHNLTLLTSDKRIIDYPHVQTILSRC